MNAIDLKEYHQAYVGTYIRSNIQQFQYFMHSHRCNNITLAVSMLSHKILEWHPTLKNPLIVVCITVTLITYPFTVDDMKTRYGPSRFLTSGRGIAAASSMHTSSAWPNLCASPGWMYCTEKGKRPVYHKALKYYSKCIFMRL